MGRRGRDSVRARSTKTSWGALVAAGALATASVACGPVTGQLDEGSPDATDNDGAGGGCTSDRECAPRGLACDLLSGSCVQCVRDANCPSGMICSGQRCITGASGCTDDDCTARGLVCDHARGACVSATTMPVCVPGEARCNASGQREVCARDGLAFQAAPCGASEACANGQCRPAATAALYGACSLDAACPGAAARCDTNFPGGSCTVRCTSSASCGAGGFCLTNVGQCYRSCTLGGHECGPAGRCVAATETTRVCISACGDPPVAGAPACGAGTACEPYSNACLPPTSFPAGAGNGSPCTAGTQCKSGVCIAEVNAMGQPTGYLGGMCVSYGRFPSQRAYQANMPLPRGTCPVGSVALAAENNLDEGDTAACFPGCSTGAECRAGYECNKRLFSGPAQPSTGFCSPINCLAAPYATMANAGCPAGTLCRPYASPTGPAGICVR